MKRLSQLSVAELRAILAACAEPKTTAEAIIQDAVTTELGERGDEDLRARIAQLEEENDTLEAQVKGLTTQIESLEEEIEQLKGQGGSLETRIEAIATGK